MERRIEQLRGEIDRVNVELRDVLQRRARLVRAIFAEKRRCGLARVDIDREREMVEGLIASPGDGFDAAALERIFRVVFAESRGLDEVD